MSATAQISDRLADIRRLVPADVMPALASAFDRAVSTIDTPMQLAIIGKISSSKSTLVNAILGKDELLPTGQKEVTFNVCWLKYGDPSSPVTIYHKDGAPPRKLPREQLDSIATIEGGNMDNISYIEILDDAEILRRINIIDTPGLNALRERDSRNTLDFIANVRPDAVIMLFTHSIQDNVLEVVREFNADSAFSPLNALGVLSKIDVLWQETFPRDRSAIEIGTKNAKGRMRKNPLLKKTLFDIFPVSSLMFLAATTVQKWMLDIIREALQHDAEGFRKALISLPKFLEYEGYFPLTVEKRRTIASTMDLYGIYTIVKELERNPELDIAGVRQLFRRESGADNFAKTLYNHFGLRAQLIKVESISQHLRSTIRRTRPRLISSAHTALLAQIEQRVADTFGALAQEHREYELLNSIYNNEIDLDPADADECCALFGEKGSSAPQMLGMPKGSTPDQLIARALERENYWRRNVALEPDPEEKKWMNIVLASYSRLRRRIQEMKYSLQLANSFLFNQ